MRWRYIFLGVLLSVPTAAAIQIWPQRPVYCITKDSRRYLLDDPVKRELLFARFAPESSDPLTLERRDADTGQLNSTTSLDWNSVVSQFEMPGPKNSGHEFFTSSDRSTIFIELSGRRVSNSDYLAIIASFDSKTGALRGSFSRFNNPLSQTISPNGRWLAMVFNSSMVVVDTRTGKTKWELPTPSGSGPSHACCFSPDSRQLLTQWFRSESPQHVLRLFDIETGQETQLFPVPEGQILCEWREGEIRTCKLVQSNSGHFLNDLGWRFRHRFDGKTLGPGDHDPLLDCNYYWLFSHVPLIDTDTWVAQFDPTDNEFADKTPLTRFVGWLESNLSLELNVLKRSTSYVRLIDRRSKNAFFEKKVEDCVFCNFALDGQFLIDANPELPAIEIYRTDIWPRWIWTTLGVLGVLTFFMLFARRRQLAVQPKRT